MSVGPIEGDVFLIPMDETSSIGGQVIAIRAKAELYVAVFGERIERSIGDPAKAIVGEPVLLTLLFDAKIFHGDWPIIGNLADFERYPDIAFKIVHSGVISIESRDRSVRRPATEGELKVLEYRSVASPAVIEDIMRAYFGNGPWLPEYDKRSAGYASASHELIHRSSARSRLPGA